MTALRLTLAAGLLIGLALTGWALRLAYGADVADHEAALVRSECRAMPPASHDDECLPRGYRMTR